MSDEEYPCDPGYCQILELADYIKALTKERDDYAFKLADANNTYSEMHVELEALTEQLEQLVATNEAARADAKEAEAYAEELEAKMGAIEQELLRRVKLAEEFKNAKGRGTSKRREHYRMHALSEALGAVRSIMKGKARATLAEIKGEKT
jgi:chromosome segregation ATPase